MAKSKVKQLWDYFIEAECGSYEKSTWCDIFLAQVLSEVRQGRTIQEILNFGNLSGIGTLIGCEILSGVHKVVGLPSDGDDLEPLRSYLFSHAWLGLVFLVIVGQPNLACSSELTNLLLFLYPVCLKDLSSSEKGNNEYLTLKPAVIKNICLPRSPPRNKIANSNASFSLQPELHRSYSHSSARSRRVLRASRSIPPESSTNQSSEEPVPSAVQPGGGLFKYDPMDFDYFTSVVRSDDDSRLDTVLYEPLRRPSRISRPQPRDLIDDAINAVLESNVSPYEFCRLSLQLLTLLADTERTFPVCLDNSLPTCTQCIKFSVENLCNLQFNSITAPLTAAETAELKVGWTQLLVLCLEKIMGFPDVTCNVLLAGILPMMLRVLEDVISKIEREDKTDMNSRLEEVAFGLLSGSLSFLYNLLHQSSDSESLRTFLEMVSQTIDSGGGRLLDRSLLALGRRAKLIIELLGLLVTAVKRIRWRLNNPASKRVRNRKMKLVDSHHHYDSFGTAAASSLLSPQQKCCVSSLAMVFIRLMQTPDKLHSDSLITILRTMSTCGTCCCMPIKSPIKSLVEILKGSHTRARALAFSLFEKTIYRQLGAYKPNRTNSDCTVCANGNVADSSTWNKLEFFQEAIVRNEGRLSPSIICHLMRVLPLMRSPVKEIILFQVFYPAFVQCKSEYQKEASDSREFVILSALSVFATLLTETTVKKFLELKGVSHILDLIYNPIFSKQCCAALEQAIVCEWNLNSGQSATSSLEMLKTVTEAATSSFLTTIGVECGARRAMGTKRGRKSESSTQDSGSVLQHLQTVEVFWRSYASLVIAHESLRKHLTDSPLLDESSSLLLVALGCLTKNEKYADVLKDKESLNSQLTKLVESLLTFLLVTSPSESVVKERTIQSVKSVMEKLDTCRVDVKKICEVVTKCSLVKPSPPACSESNKLQIPTIPICSGAVDEGTDLSEDGESSATADDDFVTADEGYDADVEIRKHLYFGNDTKSVESESSSNPDGTSERSFPIIMYPELCKLVVDFSIRAFNETLTKLANTQPNDSKKRMIDDVEQSLCAVFLRLRALCHENSVNCVALCRQGFIASLLDGFKPCLIDADSPFVFLRNAVLRLIADLARFSILPQELKAYLHLFKNEKPPLTDLLKPLVALLSGFGPRPSFIMTFPVPSPPDPESQFEKNIHRSHRNLGVISCWSASALMLNIPGSLGWSPWLTGCSISLWLRIDRGHSVTRKVQACTELARKSSQDAPRRVSLLSPNRKASRAESQFSAGSESFTDLGFSVDDDPPCQIKNGELKTQLHAFSLGSESLAVEVWLHGGNNSMTFLLTRVDSTKGYEVVAEHTAESGLLNATWHHISLNITDFVRYKKTFIEITWLVDGLKETKILLGFAGLVMRKPRDLSLMVGHQVSHLQSAATLSIASIMMFKAPVFTRAKALALAALGPDAANLTDCRVAKSIPNFGPLIRLQCLSDKTDWESLLNDASCGLRDVADALLMAYSAQDPTALLIYQGGVNGSASSLLFRPVTFETSSAQLPPVVTLPLMLAPLSCKKDETILCAARLIGGSSIFLYLYARVVELGGSAAEQADALFVLLQLVQADISLYTEFIKNDHPKLIRKIFLSQACHVSEYVLKAIFDSCSDKPILVESGGKLELDVNNGAIVRNAELLLSLATKWMDSAKDSRLLSLLFQALQTLVQDQHPHRDLNIAQLNRVKMMTALLNFSKERRVSEDKAGMSRDVLECVVELVRSLMGAPPELAHVVQVMDTILLLHPANSTYITHLKNSFYLQISAGQSYVTSNSRNPQRMEMLKQVSSISLEKWVGVMKANQAAKDEFASPIDANKLAKALATLELKQANRAIPEAHSPLGGELTSTSITSDNATQDSGISENADPDVHIVKAVDGSRQNLVSFFPSMAEGFTDSPVSEENEKCVKDALQNEEGDSITLEGLLLLLRDVLLILPDNMSNQVLSHVVRFQILLVLANHQSHLVRTAVVQLINSYLKRADEEERSRFIRIRGFHHLANQISLYPASLPLAEACLNLLTPYFVPLDDQTFLDQINLTGSELARLPPLIALLPRSVHDAVLTHNVINVLRSIFCKNALCAKALMDHGLLEVLVKAILASAHITTVSGRITSQDVVVADLQSFLFLVGSHFVTIPIVTNMQVVCDMRLELQYSGRVELESCGPGSKCLRLIRETQSQLFERCLDLLLEKLLALQTDMRAVTTLLSLGIPPPDDLFTSRSTTSSHSSQSSSFISASPSGKELSKAELKERLGMLVSYSVQFLINESSVENDCVLIGQTEEELIRRLLPLLLQMMSATMEKRSYGRRSSAGAVLWSLRETLRNDTAEFMVWLMCPRQSLNNRLFVVYSLLVCSRAKDVLASLLQTHPQIEQKFTVFLWHLMYSSKMSGAELRACMELKENLQQWGVLSPHAVGNSHDTWGAECQMLLSQMDRQRGVWEKQMESGIIRCVAKYDNLVKSAKEDAMMMTRIAVEAQNVERKTLMADIRKKVSEDVSGSALWRTLLEQLTHERALWCDSRNLPKFWQLDPTEGPQRVRIRLMPAKLSLAPRYLKPEHQHKLDHQDRPQPLAYLFERHRETCPSSVVIERLHCNEKIRTMIPARVITPAHEVPGELLLGESSLYFVADDKHLCSTLEVDSTAWPFEDVREVHHRRFQLQERAIELFLRTGRTYLIAFHTCAEKDEFANALGECELPNLTNSDTLSHYTNLWRERQITNWEYLTQLNKIAGRSFNDLMQYPVFPFILADYTSEILDLTNPASFRNLKKPMAVQDKQHEQHYINNYNELLSGLKQVSLNREPYHYGSHYSNSGTVLHFLVRLPPFTTMLLQYQDRNFDLPDRTFHSLATTWRLTSCDSTTDVKEMLPEFFYNPEFLTNSQGFNFGVRQNGERVEDVELPPWCKGDPRLFVMIHRQALESDFITENLPYWIDLVFGYKQTGKAAVEAINVFHPATYCGFDVETIQDPVERVAWETMVKTYGQTPRQLLRTPHPLVIQTLVTPPASFEPVIKEVKGLKWGSYVGSPIESELRIAWKQTSKDRSVAATLFALSTNDVFALPPASVCLVRFTKEKGLSLVNSTTIRAAVVSWNHPDGIIRVKIKKEQLAEPVYQTSYLNPVVTCCSAPESGQLWMGHLSGAITVLKYTFRPDRQLIDFTPLPIHLQAHQSDIIAMAMSRPFSIVVSCSRDGSFIIWDLNNTSYVRSVDLGVPVHLVAISNTLGDIATVTQSATDVSTSTLHVHTINASKIGSIPVKDAPITSICFSNATEGISVNVIACGLANGVIRLWSTWNLAHVRDIRNSAFTLPIISLTYSHDSQHLFAGYADGTTVVFESSGVKFDSHPPKFLHLKTLL